MGTLDSTLTARGFDEVDLDELELLKNDGYAYAQFYQNQLQNYLLRRGDFELTGAGRELAEIVDQTVGDEGDRILSCARDVRAERGDFEAIARGFANQSVYLEDDFESERRALQKIMLGFVPYAGGRSAVDLTKEYPIEDAKWVDCAVDEQQAIERVNVGGDVSTFGKALCGAGD